MKGILITSIPINPAPGTVLLQHLGELGIRAGVTAILLVTADTDVHGLLGLLGDDAVAGSVLLDLTPITPQHQRVHGEVPAGTPHTLLSFPDCDGSWDWETRDCWL